MRRVRMPWRHRPVADLVADRLRPGAGILVGQERHRGDLARDDGTRAVLVEDRRDILGEGWDTPGGLRRIVLRRIRRGRTRRPTHSERQPRLQENEPIWSCLASRH